MPDNLAKYLPWLTDAERAELYGSITSVTASPRGDPVREGVIQGGRDLSEFEESMLINVAPS